VKNPAEKITATTETANMTPPTRRAQTGKWLPLFRRRGWAELASVAKAVGSSRDCSGWAELSLVGMLQILPLEAQGRSTKSRPLTFDGAAGQGGSSAYTS
jgi:hypothetical protein